MTIKMIIFKNSESQDMVPLALDLKNTLKIKKHHRNSHQYHCKHPEIMRFYDEDIIQTITANGLFCTNKGQNTKQSPEGRSERGLDQ